FAAARMELDEQGARPLRAIVDLDEARMKLRRDAKGDRRHANLLRQSAREQFVRIGMTGWVRRADSLRCPSACDLGPSPPVEDRSECLLSMAFGARAADQSQGEAAPAAKIQRDLKAISSGQARAYFGREIAASEGSVTARFTTMTRARQCAAA